MQLTEIKLSGFKSFVDPTHIKFPSNIMGVVGPNGCGKSNVIDAVRWVMGESSARQLRGESMSDVIFSGSSARKPVTTATVELLFDNSDGRAGGEYANFGEISVKRQVSRDGQSNYYLNGQRCRRKDITDLFLGTGLGPRSYAIIEQGMISQIVEARPEELRGFLEEAAGISRYKERRRETENRIRHTRENLERLTDLREEVTKQLEKLQRQAKAAKKYRELKESYRVDEAKLLALRWRETQRQLDEHNKRINALKTELESRMAEQRAAEKELENLRQAQQAASEETQKIQAALYEVGAEIARLEQAIEHQKEIKARQAKEHAQIEQQMGELQQHLVLDKAQVSQTATTIAELEPKLKNAQSQEQDQQTALNDAEAALSEWQQQWDALQANKGELEGEIKLTQQRIAHLDEGMHQAAERINHLKDSEIESQLEQLGSEKKDLADGLAQLKRQADSLKQDEAALAEQEAQQLGAIENDRDALEDQRAQASRIQSRLESLELLNQAHEPPAKARAWLESTMGGATPPALMDRLEVTDAAWTPAVEQVLTGWLAAHAVDPDALDAIDSSTAWGFGFVSTQETSPQAGTLGEKVRHAGGLVGVLNQVHVADDVGHGQRRLAQLSAGESVILADGTWMGPGWVKQPINPADESLGVLARKQEIEQLTPKLAAVNERIEALTTRLAQSREQLDALHAKQGTHTQTRRANERDHANAVAQLTGLETRIDNLRASQAEQAEELARLHARQAEHAEEVKKARAALETQLAALTTSQQQEDELNGQRQTLTETRSQHSTQLSEARAEREAHALKLQSARAGLDSLSQSIDRMDQQVGELQSRYLELSEVLARGDAPIEALEKDRDELLTRRLEVEETMRLARVKLDEIEANRASHDQKRQAALAAVEQLREQSTQATVEQRELEIHAQGLIERIEALEADLNGLLAQLADDAETQAFQEKLEALEAQIKRLEPVNLAAIDELETESERKTYLDAQNADLEEALATLEKAIEKIDRESRTRFKETFDQINTNLARLFPRLFGGGHAHLEMVGEDWLSAGIAIMARPPGKRVARIHLMSGGEKALTAVAFVFSIFNLNPAPFCLLDEVDAPLDDANVGRFTEMVKEMAQTVQFILVTHNKVTMEAAHQMLGVTMGEPGVSRLVSVDLDKAVAMAQAG